MFNKCFYQCFYSFKGKITSKMYLFSYIYSIEHFKKSTDIEMLLSNGILLDIGFRTWNSQQHTGL